MEGVPVPPAKPLITAKTTHACGDAHGDAHGDTMAKTFTGRMFLLSFFDLGPTAGPTLYLASRDFGIPDIFQVGFGLNSGLIFGNRGIDITRLSSALSPQPL